MSSCEIVGHRGSSYVAPENTLASFNLAWQEGADNVECDVRMTLDGKIVCLHDEDTGRTGNSIITVASKASGDVSQIDVGFWKGSEYRSERVPLLEDVFATVPDAGKIYVEIKCGSEILSSLRDTVMFSSLRPDQIRILAFDQDIIKGVKDVLPAIKTHWLAVLREEARDGLWGPTFDEAVEVLKETGADGIGLHAHDSIDKSIVGRFHAEGFEFNIWTVDEPEIARRFIDIGVDSVTTNRPGWLRKQLKGLL